MEQETSLPHRQLRNCSVPAAKATPNFTAAQAAKKYQRKAAISLMTFTAAQAAKKSQKPCLFRAPCFTAAQAAKKC